MVINIIAGEVVEKARHTEVFGRLQGIMMLAQSLGYLSNMNEPLEAKGNELTLNIVGGIIGNAFGIKAPFEVSCACFVIACLYVEFALPQIPRDIMAGAEMKNDKYSKSFLRPLRVLAPQRVRLANGQVKRHFGVIFLCLGVFIGVVS